MVKLTVIFYSRQKKSPFSRKMQAEGADEAASLMRWLAFYALDEQESCLEIVLRLLKLAYVPDNLLMLHKF
jgi:hypothetical protein